MLASRLVRVLTVVAVCVALFVAAEGAGGVITAAVTRDMEKHHAQLQERRRRLQVFDTGKLYGPFRALAYFYADAYLGTPPQRATVIVDSGSSLLAIPCAGCQHCGAHTDPHFDMEASSTARFVPCNEHPPGVSCYRCTSQVCGYAISYAEGSSLKGSYVEDVAWIGSDDSDPGLEQELGVPFLFGCHSSENGLFTSQQADGIMGVGPSAHTLVAQLWKHGKLDDYLFTMCLTPMGGLLSIGGINASNHAAPLSYVPFLGSRYYQVSVSAVQVQGGQVIETTAFNRGKGVIVDSGTSFSYLPNGVFNSVTKHIKEYCSSSSDHCVGVATSERGESICYDLSDPSHLDTFPSLAFRLDGTNLVVPPGGLFQTMDWFSHPGRYCLGVYADGSSGGVIGANAMMYHDVVFDLAHKRVGFARSTCAGAPDAPGLGGPGGFDTANTPGNYSKFIEAAGMIGAALAIVAFAVLIGFVARNGCPDVLAAVQARRGRRFTRLDQQSGIDLPQIGVSDAIDMDGDASDEAAAAPAASGSAVDDAASLSAASAGEPNPASDVDHEAQSHSAADEDDDGESSASHERAVLTDGVDNAV